MPTTMLIILLALWVGHALGARCSAAAPVALPVTFNVVDPDFPDTLIRGIPARIGTPAQDIVVLPWAELNNTYIYDEEAFCDSTIIFSDKICEIRRGGLFQDDESTSFLKASDLIAAGGATQELSDVRAAEKGVGKLLSTSLAGTERLDIGSTGSFTTMPIGIPRLRWDHGYTQAHALGLGANSTLLNALVEAGRIPSRVWSVFWGRMWTGRDATELDGSLVLGGYDQEKIIGANVTQALDYSDDTGCSTGMMVTVSDVLVNFRNGSDHSVMGRSSGVRCCIVPQRQLVWEGPIGMVGDFMKATRMEKTGTSYGMHWSAQMLNTSKTIFDGDATFVLSNGLSIRIPNNQLITPHISMDRSGAPIVEEDKPELLFGGVGNNPTTLGRYFFTAAYLMVDHDAHTFTMWQANPSSRTNLVPVVGSEYTDDTGCDDGGDSGQGGGEDGDGGSGGAGGGIAGGSNTGEGGSTPDPNATTSSGLGAGTIAGGVVGGVGGLSVIAVALFFLLRRMKKKKDLAAMSGLHPVRAEDHQYSPGGAEVYYKKATTGLHEAPGHEHIPQEVDGYGQTRQELDGHGSVAWTANSGTVMGSSVTYELDGGGMPREYRSTQ